jgi:hypothetical protein
MGVTFDLDPAAPIGGPWHVPARAYFTAEDDGLSLPWNGSVFLNPPYSNFLPWAQRFTRHENGIALMGICLPEVRWFPLVFAAADHIAFISVDFQRPDGSRVRLRQQVFVAFKGLGADPAKRLAAADPYGAMLYGAPPRCLDSSQAESPPGA